MSFHEGDFVRHVLDRELETYEVVRVEQWPLSTVLVVSNVTGELDPRHTFKVEADQCRLIRPSV